MCSNEDSVPTGVRFRTITGATTPTAGMGEISGDDKVDESRRAGVWMSGCASCVGTHAPGEEGHDARVAIADDNELVVEPR
jgi:hypothetical protein